MRSTLEPSGERTPQGYRTKIGLVMVAAICFRSWEGDFCLLNQTGIFARAGNNSSVSGRSDEMRHARYIFVIWYAS